MRLAGARAYSAFVAANRLQKVIDELGSLPESAEPDDYRQASEKIRGSFSATTVPAGIVDELRAAYGGWGRAAPVAVRSSATAEDLAGASFAGQQETVLDVRGDEALLAAVVACWASLWSPRAMAYRARQGIPPGAVTMAVVVQRMVDADAAGVMFTVDPVGGRRDEVVIGAAWGLGEAIVSGAVSTDDLVVEKSTGRVRSRTTADKQVMTVVTGHGAEERPVPEARRRQPVLDDATAAELARLGVRIETHFGAPQDVEWALAGERLVVLQARPVTALPEPAAEPPTDWSVPDPKALYFRASIVEQLPDPLSPLFADLVDPSVTRSLLRFVRELGGGTVLRDGDVGLPTVNGYAYYRYTRRGMLRFVRQTGRAVRFLFRAAEKRWREDSRPRYGRLVESWRRRPVAALRAGELLAGATELLDAGTEYYTSVQTIIPLAAGSESVFTGFYQRLVRRAGDPPASTFLLGFDSAPIRADKSLHALAEWARGHPALAAAVRTASARRALDDAPVDGVDAALWAQWRARFRAHLDRFGHAVYNLDPVNPVPADDPAPLLDALRFHLGGRAEDPYERQRRLATRREEATADVVARLDPVRRAVFRRLLRAAQRTAPLREDALADVGLAWPLLRRLLLEAGRRLVDAGTVGEPSDVFWLRHTELAEAAAELDAGPTRAPSLDAAVEQRKVLWRGQRKATPPQLLPRATWNRLLDRMMPAVVGDQTGDTLRGVAASSGVVTAPARVLSGPADFGQMQPGEVLVAGITTPAWTALFTLAAAVVTDIGGPLSHSSIVAREYGIPAVLGTGAATKRIRTGQRVRVDGDAGTVRLLDDDDDETALDERRP